MIRTSHGNSLNGVVVVVADWQRLSAESEGEWTTPQPDSDESHMSVETSFTSRVQPPLAQKMQQRQRPTQFEKKRVAARTFQESNVMGCDDHSEVMIVTGAVAMDATGRPMSGETTDSCQYFDTVYSTIEKKCRGRHSCMLNRQEMDMLNKKCPEIHGMSFKFWCAGWLFFFAVVIS